MKIVRAEEAIAGVSYHLCYLDIKNQSRIVSIEASRVTFTGQIDRDGHPEFPYRFIRDGKKVGFRSWAPLVAAAEIYEILYQIDQVVEDVLP